MNSFKLVLVTILTIGKLTQPFHHIHKEITPGPIMNSTCLMKLSGTTKPKMSIIIQPTDGMLHNPEMNILSTTKDGQITLIEIHQKMHTMIAPGTEFIHFQKQIII